MGEGFPPLAEIVRPQLAPKTFAVGAILAARVPTNMVYLSRWLQHKGEFEHRSSPLTGASARNLSAHIFIGFVRFWCQADIGNSKAANPLSTPLPPVPFSLPLDRRSRGFLSSGHAIAALWHHYAAKDGVLMRMLRIRQGRLQSSRARIGSRAANGHDLIDVKSGPQFGAYTP